MFYYFNMFIIFGKSYCPYCRNACDILKKSNKKHLFLSLDKNINQEHLDELINLELIPTTYNTIPKVIKYKKNKNKSKFIGGYEDLVKYLKI